jgi:hypothetical protein
MTDAELVARLRSGLSEFPDWEEASDRIESLTSKLAKAVEAMEYFFDGWGLDGPDYKIDHFDKEQREQEWAFSKFRETLKDINGE